MMRLRGFVYAHLSEAIGVGMLGTAAVIDYQFYDTRRAIIPEFLSPLFLLLPPEMAHRAAIRAAQLHLLPGALYWSKKETPMLKCELWGRTFENPVGIAAGFDKNGEAIQGLFGSGAGFIEIGSITPKPQEGNAKPRVFRLYKDKAVINRYGFNNDGLDVVEQRLKALERPKDPIVYNEDGDIVESNEIPRRLATRGIVGINLGKNKETVDAADDYVRGVKRLARFADYLVINVSSPNTPNLRDLQKKSELEELLSAVKLARDSAAVAGSFHPPPILLKVAPDLSVAERKDISQVALKYADGLIVSNTTVARPDSLIDKETAKEIGGLSGAPLKHKSTEMVRDMFKFTNGRLPIIGVGGIENAQDAMDKIRAGASLVQVYTPMVYHGPQLINKIKYDLIDTLKKEKIHNIIQCVGVDALEEIRKEDPTWIHQFQKNNVTFSEKPNWKRALSPDSPHKYFPAPTEPPTSPEPQKKSGWWPW